MAVVLGSAAGRAEAQDFDVPSISVDGARCAIDVRMPLSALGARVRGLALVVAGGAQGASGLVPMTCGEGRVVREIGGAALSTFAGGATHVDGELSFRIGAPDVR